MSDQFGYVSYYSNMFRMTLFVMVLLAGVACRQPDPGDLNPHGSRDAVRILPLGNSITMGDSHTYRSALYDLLDQAGWDFNFIGNLNDNPAQTRGRWDQDHEGHPGWTTVEIATWIGTWLKTYTPDIVLVHLGTNDLIAIGRGKGSLDESESALRAVITKLRHANPRVRILLGHLLPIYADSGVLLPLVSDWNERISMIAADLSTSESSVEVVDLHQGFTAEDLEDGVHPTAAGAVKMAQRWRDALGE